MDEAIKELCETCLGTGAGGNEWGECVDCDGTGAAGSCKPLRCPGTAPQAAVIKRAS